MRDNIILAMTFIVLAAALSTLLLFLGKVQNYKHINKFLIAVTVIAAIASAVVIYAEYWMK